VGAGVDASGTFSPETGCPFWLQWAEKAGWDPRKEIRSTRISTSSACSRTSGCAAARSGAGCRRAYKDQPIYTFETGGSTGVPKSRINIDDFRIDYEQSSTTLLTTRFPGARTG
jgi:hypothetical protein